MIPMNSSHDKPISLIVMFVALLLLFVFCLFLVEAFLIISEADVHRWDMCPKRECIRVIVM